MTISAARVLSLALLSLGALPAGAFAAVLPDVAVRSSAPMDITVRFVAGRPTPPHGPVILLLAEPTTGAVATSVKAQALAPETMPHAAVQLTGGAFHE